MLNSVYSGGRDNIYVSFSDRRCLAGTSWHPVRGDTKVPHGCSFQMETPAKTGQWVGIRFPSYLLSLPWAPIIGHIIENYFRTSVSRWEGAMGLAAFLSLHRRIEIIAHEEIWESHQLELCSISSVYTLERIITLLSLHNRGERKLPAAVNSQP